MNRRWQKDGVGRYDTLPSVNWMLAQLSSLNNNLGIADVADVYSVLSALHAKSRNPQPCTSPQGFYYFMADAPAGVNGKASTDAPEQRQTSDQQAPKRLEPVIPISSKSQKLTMRLISSLFNIHGQGAPPATHIMLAIVDDDGSVSLTRCFAHIQPPYEGPGMLPDALGEATGIQAAADSEDDDG